MWYLRFRIRLRTPRGTRVVSATVSINGKVRARVKRGKVRAPVDLRGLPKGKVTVRVAVKASDGRTYKGKRTYRTCAARK